MTKSFIKKQVLYLLCLALLMPGFAHADTIIFTETCRSNPVVNLDVSTTITVGTSWSARITLLGTPAQTIQSSNTATMCLSAGTQTANTGVAYTMTPAPTTDEYYVDYLWQDGGNVAASSTIGAVVNYIDASNYYFCATGDDATPEAFIYRVKAGVGTPIASALNRTVADNSKLECRINYTGTNPVITFTNITTATVLTSGTDSSAPLTNTKKAGVMCGGTPASAADECQITLGIDAIHLSEVPLAAPTVTTGAASAGVLSAVINGNITATGGSNSTVRGFAWGTNSTLSNGDTATSTESGSFGISSFVDLVSGLIAGRTYYFRAYATNSAGTGYGTVLNFTAGTDTSVTRKMRLFGGYTIKFISGRIILHQK
mgnify:CR=1 FL=1